VTIYETVRHHSLILNTINKCKLYVIYLLRTDVAFTVSIPRILTCQVRLYSSKTAPTLTFSAASGRTSLGNDGSL